MSGHKDPNKQEVKQEHKPVTLKLDLKKAELIPVCSYASPYLMTSDGRLLDCAAINSEMFKLAGHANHTIALNYSHDTQQLVTLSSTSMLQTATQTVCVWDEKALNSPEKKPSKTFDLQLLEKNPIKPPLKTLYMPTSQHGIFVCHSDVCLIDFEKKTSKRQPMQQDIVASAFVEPHYLALVLRNPYQKKSGKLTYEQEITEEKKEVKALQNTCIALYDIEQKNYLDKPIAKFAMENIVDLQVLPGGKVWAITTDKIPGQFTEEQNPHYVTVCAFDNHKKPLKIVDAFMYDHESKHTIVGHKLFYCDPQPTGGFSIQSYNPYTGKKADIANLRTSPLELFSTNQGLCTFRQEGNSYSLAFYPSTLEVSELTHQLTQAVPKFIPPGIISIESGYAGHGFFAHPNYQAPVRPPQPIKIEEILARIDSFLTKPEVPKNLHDDLIKLKGLLEKNDALHKLDSYINECEHLRNLHSPIIVATNINDRLGILMDDIRKLDKFEVIEFRK